MPGGISSMSPSSHSTALCTLDPSMSSFCETLLKTSTTGSGHWGSPEDFEVDPETHHMQGLSTLLHGKNPPHSSKSPAERLDSLRLLEGFFASGCEWKKEGKIERNKEGFHS
ncbi:unnamed protein product [Pleuronectes platessa]|uniref:Uncharacterized protein n=1 Tax=Pleuronectes platessa TaxID=8262 RepID=A0A9N7UYR9_PLEPL|nr:unnamed protein product [Pleuronectes platessa]